MSRHLIIVAAAGALLLVSCMKAEGGDATASKQAPPSAAGGANDRRVADEGWFGSGAAKAPEPEATEEEEAPEEMAGEVEDGEWDAPAAAPVVTALPAANAATITTDPASAAKESDRAQGQEEQLRYHRLVAREVAQKRTEEAARRVDRPNKPKPRKRPAPPGTTSALKTALVDGNGYLEGADGFAAGDPDQAFDVKAEKKVDTYADKLAVGGKKKAGARVSGQLSELRIDDVTTGRDAIRGPSGVKGKDGRLHYRGSDEDDDRKADRGLELGKSSVTRQRKTNQPHLGLLDALQEVPDLGEIERPTSFLPRMGYFENTYLGGNAAHAERMRRLRTQLGHEAAWTATHAPVQPFDAPGAGAISLSATLDRRWVDRPGRVFLQIGLQGSHRYGWRRPPLDVVLVVDAGAVADGIDRATELSSALMGQLGPQDRLGVILAGGTPQVVAEPTPVRKLRVTLARQLEQARVSRAADAGVAAAIRQAGTLLAEAAKNEARVPGSQVVLLAAPPVAGPASSRASHARVAAHELTVQGAVTSVIELPTGTADQHGSEGMWWSVAAAGHGNYHRAGDGDLAQATARELELLSKVVARLLRVNIRLAGKSRATRIIGSRLLEQKEVKRVKAREVATDRNLSKTMGVTADRGDDDDGLQTVIPYYYGGDSHVILVELWVEEPGAVAEVTLKYKDMVQLGNATARVGVSLSRTPRPDTPAQQVVRSNVRSFEVADALLVASEAAQVNDRVRAARALQAARTWAFSATDQALVDDLARLLDNRAPAAFAGQAMEMAARRRVGLPPAK